MWKVFCALLLLSAPVGAQIEITESHRRSTAEKTEVTFEARPQAILVTHTKAFFPCCLVLKVEVTLRGDELRIKEVDESPPCLCPLLPFDIEILLRNVHAGSYRVYLIDPSDRILGQADLQVPSGGQADFVRGDIDGDGKIAINDPILILGYLFKGTEVVVCADAADANDSGKIDIADALYLLQYLFAGGAEPPAPFPEPGPDPTEDSIHCAP